MLPLSSDDIVGIKQLTTQFKAQKYANLSEILAALSIVISSTLLSLPFTKFALMLTTSSTNFRRFTNKNVKLTNNEKYITGISGLFFRKLYQLTRVHYHHGLLYQVEGGFVQINGALDERRYERGGVKESPDKV